MSLCHTLVILSIFQCFIILFLKTNEKFFYLCIFGCIGSLLLRLFFFFFFFISWRLITLQYFSGFCHTLKWIRFLPGEFHGQRSLAGYSPWDREESGMAECLTLFLMGFPGGSSGKKKKKKSACSAGDLGSIRGSGRCPGEGMATHSTSFFENSKDKGTWWQVHGFAKSQIPLSNCYWICDYNCHIFWINWYFVSFKSVLLGWY